MSWLACLIVAFVAALFIPTQAEAHLPRGADENMRNRDWSMVAKRDLAKAHDALHAAHPAMFVPEDAEFHQWMRVGLQEAEALAEIADSSARADAAVRFYLAGFKDGHVLAWRAQQDADQARWAGWTVQPRGENFFVVDRADTWDGPLPPSGARLVSCDGLAVKDVVAQRISPYVDRRLFLEGSRSRVVALLSNALPMVPLWDAPPVQKCLFSDGARMVEIALKWRQSGEGLRRVHMPTPKQEIQSFGGGQYWLHATNFAPKGQELDALDAILRQLREMSDASVVVLDLRGNGGGDSGVGIRMIRALLKSAAPTLRTDAEAFWRVSSLAISSVEGARQRELSQSGRDTPKYRFLDATVRAMKMAMARKEAFVRQDMSAIKDDLTESGAPFKGKLVLVTDGQCASACLDMVDLVRSIPGAVHVGATTSADTPYLEVATVTLPSGLNMWVPTKMWRHRQRGNNQPVVPVFPFPGDVADTVLLRDWLQRVVLPKASKIAQ